MNIQKRIDIILLKIRLCKNQALVKLKSIVPIILAMWTISILATLALIIGIISQLPYCLITFPYLSLFKNMDIFTGSAALIAAVGILYQGHQTKIAKTEKNSKFYLEKYITACDLVLKRTKQGTPTRRIAWVAAASIAKKAQLIEAKITEQSDKDYLEIYQRDFFHRITHFIHIKSPIYYYDVDNGHELSLRPSEDAELLEGRIYIEEKNGKIAYPIITNDGKINKEILTDIDSPSPFLLENLAPLKDRILESIKKNGYILDNDFKELNYARQKSLDNCMKSGPGLIPKHVGPFYIDENHVLEVLSLTKPILKKDGEITCENKSSFLTVIKIQYPGLYKYLSHLGNYSQSSFDF